MKTPEEISKMSDPSTIAIKVGVELLKRVTPQGIAWLTQWFRGRKILIVGQPRAVKWTPLSRQLTA
ncbi:MAG: hypothetical protein Q8L68_02015 [Methylococcales bacterium]|nr:hypothetical protein [Methylococcales bacterium]